MTFRVKRPPAGTGTIIAFILILFLIACYYPATAQTTKLAVNGTVADSSGGPLPGVTIQEKGTKNATLSKPDGTFTLNVSSDKAVLLFSFIGFIPQEVNTAGRTSVSVRLQNDKTDLGEVIVVGYGTKRKGSVTGAIASISADDIGRVHGGSTVSATMAGKLPGVTFRMPDGRPGASANIQIRNLGDPLYVIDGIQQDAGQFNNLAPNDIESITVLKDASAAIYGVRAANGVVVVTTKKGKLGARNVINVDAYTGIQNWTRFPDVLTNSYDYMKYRAEGEINRYGSTTITDAELEKYKAGTERGYQSFDWKNFILKKNAPIHSVNASITGGSDRINYYMSGTHLYQNSMLGREFVFKRTNIQSNLDAKVTDRLKVGVQINGRIETRDNPGVPYPDDYWLARFAIMRNTPLERPYANDNPNYLNDIKHNETNWAYLNKTNSGKFRSDWRVLQANFSGEYQVPGIKGLTLKGIYSYYIADHVLNNHEYTYVTYTYNPADDTYRPTGGSSNPWREREQIKQINTNQQIQLNYNNTFGRHSISATLVNERIRNQRLRNWIHAVPTTNVLPLIYFSTADTYDDSDDIQTRIGYIGRFSYSYNDKYFLEIAGRRDASYLFAPDRRVGYFPSVSAGWRISEEPFLKYITGNSTMLSDLKIRASYGIMGDDGTQLGLPAYAYLPGYNYNQGIAIIGGVPVVGSRDKGVPITNISWLKSRMFDVGADFSLLNGKISGTFDYFYRKRTGLRGRKADVLVPSELGYALPDENINSDAQYGQEISLNYNGKIGQVNFTAGGNFSYSRQKFLESYKPVYFNSWDHYRNAREQRFTWINWGLETIGQFTSQEQINSYPVNIDGQGNRTLLPGDLIYKDQNNDGKIDGYDERPIGMGAGAAKQPNINFGFSIGLSYRNFDFHADFSGGAGYTWFQNWETKNPFQNDGNLNTIFLDRWHRADMRDPNSEWIPGKYPALRFNEGGHSNYRNSDFWAHNVKYLRARTIELGYTIPTSVLNIVRMQKARFYANVYNLFSIDNLSQYDIDPEINEENGLQFPQSQVFNVGVNLTF